MTQRRVDALANASQATPPSDIDPPFLTNQVPAPASTGVLPSANITFRVNDAINPVSPSSIVVTVNIGFGLQVAYNGSIGGFQPGFTGTVTPFLPNGFDFVINPTGLMNEFALISVRVEATDTSIFLNHLDATYTFTTGDVSAPFVINQNPAVGSTVRPVTSNISFKIDDTGSGVVLGSINVSVKQGAGSFIAAIINGAFQPGWNGAGSSISASGLGFSVTIDPVANLAFEATILVRVQADDVAPNHLDTTYSFTTQISIIAINSFDRQRDGGYTVTFTGSIPDGTYFVHVGPLGSDLDPLCYSGVPGAGTIVTAVGGSVTVVLPPLPAGGPYSFTLVTITGLGPPHIVTMPSLTVTPHEFRGGTLALRRLLPTWWKLGYRNPGQEDYPQ